mmetsp:Transcript_66387/g.130828  ORF Transcript_66387/g.130828 Transcript_66387/m.130828 type:complete len:283 (-) Transcript_66387:108-956(-)
METLAPDALQDTETELIIRSIEKLIHQREQQRQQRRKQQPKPKSKLKPKGKLRPQRKQLQPALPFVELTPEEFEAQVAAVVSEGIETEKASSVDAVSTPEKVCRSSRSLPEHKCNIQQGSDLVGKHSATVKNNQVRMQGVYWDPRHLRWLVQGRRGDKGSRRSFSRHQFLNSGMTAEEADEEAMRQAFAYRQSLVDSGTVRLYRTSGMKNIHWCSQVASWKVLWYEDGKRRVRPFAVRDHMDSGTSTEEAKEAALWKAVAFRATVLQQMQPQRNTRPKLETS